MAMMTTMTMIYKANVKLIVHVGNLCTVRWRPESCPGTRYFINKTTRSSAIAGRPCDAKACQRLLKLT